MIADDTIYCQIVCLTGFHLHIILTYLKIGWHHQEILYDFQAQIQGTGNRSDFFPVN